MSTIPKNKGKAVVLCESEVFATLWILQIIDVELDNLSKYVPHTEEYRVLLWFEGKEKDMMVTGPSISNPNPTWKEEFLVHSYDPNQQYEYLKLEVIQLGKEPGTSQGFGAVARVRVALPKYYGKQSSGRFTLVGTCESSIDGKSVGFITLCMEKRRIGRMMKPPN